MKQLFSIVITLLLFTSCINDPKVNATAGDKSQYLDYSKRDDVLSGGVRMIPIKTKAGEFKVWTKRIGNNPTMKVLILNGGPGVPHGFYQAFDSYFPNAEIEYYYYDQLDAGISDQPKDSSLWRLERYVDEVEQVRIGLGLDKNNFYLYGHSWGGILGIEYALKYQDNLKGLIISNMVSSIPAYNAYASEVLGPQLPPEVLTEIKALEAAEDYHNPRYNELLYKHYYTAHILRMPVDEWPAPVTKGFEGLAYELYLHMQGPSEFGIVGNAALKDWDRRNDLINIKVPTLVIGARYDTMDPNHMEWMASEVKNGRYLYCANGSHLALYDEQQVYFNGLIKFIEDVDNGLF